MSPLSHDRLVEKMLSLNKRMVESRASHEQTLLQRQIEATDNQIDSWCTSFTI
jgi:hypothetical protein